MTNTDRRYGVSDALAWKAPVRAATTGNIALAGEQTIDGTACIEGDRVLAWQQTAGGENGIYVVSTGNWRRAADADGPRDLATGTMLVVTAGSSYQWAIFQLVTTGDIAIDDTALTFQTLSVQVAGSFRATSATSLPISVGAKTFAVEANRAFTAGDYVIAKSDANTNNFMVGQVMSYGGTTLVVDVEAIGGSGTHVDWSIAISGSPGATGAPGAPGPAGPAVSGIGDVPGLAAALDAKLDDSQAGAVGLNVLAATTQAAGRAAINAASDSDTRLLGRRVFRLFNRMQPMLPSFHPAFVMGDGSITVCGQASKSLAQGDVVQASTSPTVVVLPSGLLGTPVDVTVGSNSMYILTDQGDVAVAGVGAVGQLGTGSTADATIATLLDASNITPRSPFGASRAVTSLKVSSELGDSTNVTVLFGCADGSAWATGYGNYGQGGFGHFANVSSPTRCLKIANSLAQATAQGTNSSSNITPAVASRTFTVAAGKSWQAGQNIYGYSAAAIGNWWYGNITSYSGTTLIVNIAAIGTPAAAVDWIISEVVDDCAEAYAAGAPTASSAYRTMGGKARFAGRLGQGAHGLCLTGPGSGTAVANFPCFRLPKTASDDASSQLPNDYSCTRIVLGCVVNDAHSIGILCDNKTLYLVGHNGNGALGDGTTTNRSNYQVAGSGTVAAAALTGHVENVWQVSTNAPAFIAQLDTGAKYRWGYGAGFGLPGTTATQNETPAICGAPFDTTAFKIVKLSIGGSYSTTSRETVAALCDNNKAYNWGVYRQSGNGVASSSTPAAGPDPYNGSVAISDVKMGGYATVVGMHVLYANGEVWGFNCNAYSNGELGIGGTSTPSMPVRARF